MNIPATGSAARRLATAAATVDEAELRRRVAARPNSVTDWQQLGILLLRTGRPGEATDAFAWAIAAGASALVLAVPRALALSDAGRAGEAVDVLAFARKKRPKDFALTNLLGVLLKRAGRLEEAIPVLEAAKRLDPRNTAPWQNLGNVYEALGRYRDAAAAFQGGLRLTPRDPELLRLHGRALRICGDLLAALTSLERAITIAPGHRYVMAELVSVLLDLDRPESAAICVASARNANSADAAFHDVMEARIHMRQGNLDLARGLLNKAIQTDPAEPDAYFNLARAFGDGDRASANEALRRGLACNPRSTPLAGELVESLSRSRYGDEASLLQEAYDVACGLLTGDSVTTSEHAKSLRTVFRRCLDFDRFDATGSLAELAPRWIADGHIFALLHELGTVRSLEDRKRIVEWHREWGRQQSARIAPVEPLTMPALHTGRSIRVGFMSSDLRVHPVSIFARQLFDQYERDRFEVYCYSFFEGERDRVQAHIEGRVAGFRWWPRRPDAEVAAGIALDGLDVLFELGGTTAMNKLAVMAYHPARIGASWLGYPHSAGFERIDYIVTDPYIRPYGCHTTAERVANHPTFRIDARIIFSA
jgi:protein O-GlcNAc transferase